MAKQSGTIFMVGTIDDLTFYKMNGQYYVRKKSRLTRKRIKKDPQFENTRRSATRFGRGAKLASTVYRQLPKEQKRHGVMGRITAMDTRLLKEGIQETEVVDYLQLIWPPQSQPIATAHKGALSLSRWGVNKVGQLQYCVPFVMPAFAISNKQCEISKGVNKLMVNSRWSFEDNRNLTV